MAILLITYEHKTLFKDYTPFFNAIQGNCKRWCHYLDRVWMVDTTISADAYSRLLFPHMTQDDRLLIVKLSGEYQGWLTDEAWKWLNQSNFR